MKCKLLDVFTAKPLNGNGLTLFYEYDGLSDQRMLQLTQEMRQFESIFVSSAHPSSKGAQNTFLARIFTVDEELDFAGHPLIGLGAHLHEEYGQQTQHAWTIKLNNSDIELQTKISGGYFETRMHLGKPEFINTIPKYETGCILSALNLSVDHCSIHPLEVISNGLPYLIVPVLHGLEKAKIIHDNFESVLEKYGAKFVYVLDVKALEGRTWDNAGNVEDVATGSAAGPAAAYLWKHKLLPNSKQLHLSQGRFVGRPSVMNLDIRADERGIVNIELSGQVCKVANIDFV